MAATNYHAIDKKLFLVLIPFINAINYYLTYSSISLSWYTAITFTIDTLMGYAAWWMVRSIIRLLDKKLPFGHQPLRRIVIQLITTTIAGLAVISLLTELVNYLARNKPVPASFYTQDIFIFLIWFFVVNGIYIAMYYYHSWLQAVKLNEAEQNLRQQEEESRTGLLMAKLGKQSRALAYEEIAGIMVEGDYPVAYCNDKKKYFLDSSLDKLEKTLPSHLFFRLNRQLIVHRQWVTGFERGENGKLTVLLKSSSSLPLSAQVSRLKAPSFKDWFQQSNCTA